MLEYPTFFHISSKNPDDADIANRKHYSAPEGALTKFLVSMLFLWCFQKMKVIPLPQNAILESEASILHQKSFHQTPFTPGTFYTRRRLRILHQTHFTPDTFLHQTRFTPNTLCTKHILHQTHFTQAPFAPNTFTPDTFYTRHLLHQTHLTPEVFYTKHLSDQKAFRLNGFYQTHW